MERSYCIDRQVDVYFGACQYGWGRIVCTSEVLFFYLFGL
jgi:hypothetical protein